MRRAREHGAREVESFAQRENLLGRDRVSGIRGIGADLYRAAEPCLVRADEVPHEVAQKLCAAAVGSLCGCSERLFRASSIVVLYIALNRYIG